MDNAFCRSNTQLPRNGREYPVGRVDQRLLGLFLWQYLLRRQQAGRLPYPVSRRTGGTWDLRCFSQGRLHSFDTGPLCHSQFYGHSYKLGI